jgi:glycosyltransferase involved in cell wall biosynthesis
MIKLIYTIQQLAHGGAETSLLDICTHIDKDKFDVTIISIQRGDIIVERFKQIEHIKVIELNHKSRYHPFIIPQLIYHFIKIKPDVIHSNLCVADIYTRIAALFSRVKIVFTTHAPVLKSNIFYKIDSLTSKLNTKMIANSIYAKNLFLSFNYSTEKKVEIIPLGLNFNKFKTATLNKAEFFQKYSLPENAKIITFVGSFKVEKGHIYLLQAIQKLIHTNPDYYFFLVGTGKLLDEKKTTSRNYNIDKNTIFTGVQENVGCILSNSDIFVSPSIAESQGIALIEAMYFKVPVVAFNSAAVPEIVKDNQTGFLVNIYDVETLSKRVNEVMKMKLSNDQKLTKITDTAYEFVLDRFSIENTVKTLEDLYTRL